MKRSIIMALVALIAMMGNANEVDNIKVDEIAFADHSLSLYQITKEWHNQHFFTIGDEQKPTIKNYFFSFAMAYPNYIGQLMTAKLIGLDESSRVSNFVLDEHNGYIEGHSLTEFDNSIQMCYWNCANGDVIVAVAIQGREYKPEGYVNTAHDDPEEPSTIINDLMFFKVEKGEVMWLPKTPKQMTGKNFNYANYEIKLPREGKNITLINRNNGSKTTLRWNGQNFK